MKIWNKYNNDQEFIKKMLWEVIEQSYLIMEIQVLVV